MLHYGFKNYDEFKELFGYRTMNNGKKTRATSKILLDFLKSPNVHRFCYQTGNFEPYDGWDDCEGDWVYETAYSLLEELSASLNLNDLGMDELFEVFVGCGNDRKDRATFEQAYHDFMEFHGTNE